MNKQYHYAIKALTSNMFGTFALATFSLFFSVSQAANILELDGRPNLTAELINTSITNNNPQFRDHHKNQWELIAPPQLRALLSAEVLSKLSENPLFFVHDQPILLSAANTGEGNFFSCLPATPNDGDYGIVAYKVHVPRVCLTKDANVQYAELYFTRKVPLASLHLYSSNIPYAEIETNYRTALSRLTTRLSKEPEVHIPTLRANYEAGLAKKDAKIKRLKEVSKNSYLHGITMGAVTTILAYHIIYLLMPLIL